MVASLFDVMRLWRRGLADDAELINTKAEHFTVCLVELSGQVGIGADFAKSHDLQHVAEDVRRFGSSRNYSTGMRACALARARHCMRMCVPVCACASRLCVCALQRTRTCVCGCMWAAVRTAMCARCARCVCVHARRCVWAYRGCYAFTHVCKCEWAVRVCVCAHVCVCGRTASAPLAECMRASLCDAWACCARACVGASV
ncbi:MAG: hypothetical protein P4L40_03425 [Terracidiphilus sp.]|nr:hypothetical protein [Terracidiphilus sp.]